jgi:hypothetical protein
LLIKRLNLRRAVINQRLFTITEGWEQDPQSTVAVQAVAWFWTHVFRLYWWTMKTERAWALCQEKPEQSQRKHDFVKTYLWIIPCNLCFSHLNSCATCSTVLLLYMKWVDWTKMTQLELTLKPRSFDAHSSIHFLTSSVGRMGLTQHGWGIFHRNKWPWDSHQPENWKNFSSDEIIDNVNSAFLLFYFGSWKPRA